MVNHCSLGLEACSNPTLLLRKVGVACGLNNTKEAAAWKLMEAVCENIFKYKVSKA